MAEGGVDLGLDPARLNEVNEKDPFLEGGKDEELEMTTHKFKRPLQIGEIEKGVQTTSTSLSGSNKEQETSFEGSGARRKVKLIDQSIHDTGKKSIEKFPNYNPTKYKVIAKMDEWVRVVMEMMGRRNAKQHILINRNGSLAV